MVHQGSVRNKKEGCVAGADSDYVCLTTRVLLWHRWFSAGLLTQINCCGVGSNPSDALCDDDNNDNNYIFLCTLQGDYPYLVCYAFEWTFCVLEKEWTSCCVQSCWQPPWCQLPCWQFPQARCQRCPLRFWLWQQTRRLWQQERPPQRRWTQWWSPSNILPQRLWIHQCLVRHSDNGSVLYKNSNSDSNRGLFSIHVCMRTGRECGNVLWHIKTSITLQLYCKVDAIGAIILHNCNQYDPPCCIRTVNRHQPHKRWFKCKFPVAMHNCCLLFLEWFISIWESFSDYIL